MSCLSDGLDSVGMTDREPWGFLEGAIEALQRTARNKAGS